MIKMNIRLEINKEGYNLILNSDKEFSIGLLSFGYEDVDGFKLSLGKYYELFDVFPNKDVLIDSGSLDDFKSSVTYYLDLMVGDSITTFYFDLPNVSGPIKVLPRDPSLEIPVYEDGYFIRHIYQDSENTLDVAFECEGNLYSFGLPDDDGCFVDEEIKALLESGKPSKVIDAIANIREWIEFDFWAAGIVDEDEESPFEDHIN